MADKTSRAQYGSDIMAKMLHALDIDYVAVNPGSTYRGLHDSIVNYLGNKKPEMILCNHEGIAVAFAHGYAKVTGKPAVAIVHDTVGLLHCTLQIYNAFLDKAPIIILGGAGPMATEKRRPGIDWTHTTLVQGNAVRDFVKWDDQPASLAGVPDSLIRAYQIAATNPEGPVYVAFDVETQEETLTGEITLPDVKRYSMPSPPQADEDAINRVAKLLVKARNPVVIAGRTGRNPEAVEHLAALAELLALPVVDNGTFNLPGTHPLNLTGAARDLLKKADVVLALDINDMQGALSTTETQDRASTRLLVPEGCQVVHIAQSHAAAKSWPASYFKLMPVDIPVSADTAVALPLLTAACERLLTKAKRAELKERFDGFKAEHDAIRQRWQAAAKADQKNSPISISWLASQLWDIIKDEDWAMVNGNFGGWSRRLWDGEAPYRYAGGGGLASGIGHSLGAAMAHLPKNRLCIDFQSDGDLMYSPSALWTAAHHKIPLLVVMNNNHSYYNSEAHQHAMAVARGRPVENQGIGTRIEDPYVDYAAVARSFGVWGVGPVENPADLRKALKEAVKVVKQEKTLALVDVVTQTQPRGLGVG
ncbi:MAG: thiamine pyrophosphate-binding protein [Chloroflexi bacterium]|nr:thiamine pyrophosphate-binding protein [Chloroflexota bacterium]